MAAGGTGNVPHMEAWSSSIKSCLAARTRKFHTSGEDRRASQAVHCVGGTERERERARETQRAASQSAGGEECRLLLQPPPHRHHPNPPPVGLRPGCGAALLATRLWLNMKWGVVMQMTLMCAHICQRVERRREAPSRYFPSLSESGPGSPQGSQCQRWPDCLKKKKKKNFCSFVTTCSFSEGLLTSFDGGRLTLWSQAELIIRVTPSQMLVEIKKKVAARKLAANHKELSPSKVV